MAAAGLKPLRFDIRETSLPAFGDLRDAGALERAIANAAGIVHLGGVSRVVWGERCPQLCRAVNVEATKTLLTLALNSPRRPWVVYASSREVYGQQRVFPVSETAPLQPVNTYARSKVAAEQLVGAARDAGLATAIVRFSSVYGDVDDHADRVVPAFALAAVRGATLRIDGPDCAFDFTHVADVAGGLTKLCVALSVGEKNLPTLHFASGVRTTLRELAELAADLARTPTQISLASPRSFDVHQFCGDPARAAAVLGWRRHVGPHRPRRTHRGVQGMFVHWSAGGRAHAECVTSAGVHRCGEVMATDSATSSHARTNAWPHARSWKTFSGVRWHGSLRESAGECRCRPMA
jgi:nucleoside-diphosphate-sugar epimerase